MIAVYARSTKENLTEEIQNLLLRLKAAGEGVIIYEPFYKFFKQGLGLNNELQTFSTHKELKKKVSCLLSLGGDGTLLETIALVGDSGIPVLGINTGRLGFLANVSKEDINKVLDALVNKKFTIDKRVLLKLETKNKLFGDVNFALNEITVMKKDPIMMTIHAYIDGEFLNS